ncbi:MAG: cell division ATP-binding protein FtsE [Denitrovibrio sp.]|nr:MAG: cell division ATP-binding protein FtsE [Denitrovibrio sp.]
MIEMHKVDVVYDDGNVGLKGIDVHINSGEIVYITGHSGAGKTSLLRLLYGDLAPSRGIVRFDNRIISHLRSKGIAYLRREIGVVFQDLKLLEDKTVYENLMLPLEIFYLQKNLIQERIYSLLKQLDIFTHRDFPVKKLSGGEKQRVALARALINEPMLILADEPTGNLDSKNADKVMDIILRKSSKGSTTLIATHDQRIIKEYPGRVIHLDHGMVTYDSGGKRNQSVG